MAEETLVQTWNASVRGLEVGTLVFMQYKVVGDDFVELPIRTVDTGYGIDRFTWISQGVPSLFQAIYGNLLDKVMSMAGITNIDNEFLARVAKYSGLVSVDKRANRMVATKTCLRTNRHRLTNTRESPGSNRERLGSNRPHKNPQLYALRRRRAIQHPRRLPRKTTFPTSLPFNAHTKHGTQLTSTPSSICKRITGAKISHASKQMQSEIIEMLKVEEEKFVETLKRGEGMVKRIAVDLKSKGTGKLPMDTLTELYDSHGFPQKSLSKPPKKKASKLRFPKTSMH